MIVFEIKWLIIIIGFIALILGCLLLVLKKSSEYIKGPVYWAAGSFLMGSGLFLFAFHPWPQDYVNILISSFLIIASKSSYLCGIWKFKGIKINYYLVVSLLLLSILQVTVFCLISSKPAWRVAINSSIFAFIAFYSSYEMWKPTEKALTNIFRINAFVFLFYGLIMVSRVLSAFHYTESSEMNSPPLNVVFFIVAAALQGILTYGFIIMVNTKVAEDLKKQIEVKDMFFSIIAHDLNNQVNVIKGFSDLLYANTDKNYSEKNFQFVGYIRQASLQTSALLTNLLDWAKIQSKIDIFNPENTDLHKLIHEEMDAIASISCNKQISVEYVGDNIPLFITADKNMLKTILRNLLINAIKFTNQGGQVKIHTKLVPGYIEIDVSDSGIGMEPDVLKKLFRYDTLVSTGGTLKEKGTGLGLLLCKEFVEKHHGKIWVESQFEIGSSVKFTIPFTPGKTFQG